MKKRQNRVSNDWKKVRKSFQSLETLIVLAISLYGVNALGQERLHGMHFDGRTYVVITNDAANLRLDGSYTVELWVNPAAGGGHFGIFNKGTNWSGGAKCLGINALRPGFGLCNVGHSEYGVNNTLVAGQWSHVAWTASDAGGDQRIYRCYINGALNSSFTNRTWADEGFVELGRYANCCDGFVGDMVDVRYWNVTRTQAEIQEYMLMSPAGNTNLVAHWLYDLGSGVDVRDSVGGHDGVLTGASSPTNAWLSVNPAPGVASPKLQGLWVGEAQVSQVSRAPTSAAATNGWDNTPVVTAQTFPLRLLVHVDSEGGMRLLPEVYLAGATEWIVVTNYQGIAMTNSAVSTVVTNEVWQYGVYSAAANIPGTRRGQVQRLCSVGFPSTGGAVILFGATNCFAGRVELAYNDPQNPFVHVYHPDHDNKDANQQALAEGVESWSVFRKVMLQFADANPAMANDPHWKVDRWGGTYRETIEGVHRYPLYVEGDFSLQKVSSEGSIE